MSKKGLKYNWSGLGCNSGVEDLPSLCDRCPGWDPQQGIKNKLCVCVYVYMCKSVYNFVHVCVYLCVCNWVSLQALVSLTFGK
jgi:hypothetical protein